DRERQPGVVGEPLDQRVLHRSARRPETAGDVRRVATQADCAFRDHLRSRSIAGIAIAGYDCLQLPPVGTNAEEQKIVMPALALFLRRSLAWLGPALRTELVVGGDDRLRGRLTRLLRPRDHHLVIDEILAVRETEQEIR